MRRAWRWLRRLAGIVLLVLAVLLFPVGYVELMCRPQGEPAPYTPLVAAEWQRPEGRTLMTYPEWHIVHAYDDYAAVIATGDPQDFGFFTAVGGFWGALCATLGVVLPSFVIILLIASVLQNLMKYAGVNAFLGGVRPCVVAMILATAVNMALSTLAGFAADKAGIAPDLRSIVVFLLLWGLHALCRRQKGKAPSPIGMILFSAGLGILFWGI